MRLLGFDALVALLAAVGGRKTTPAPVTAPALDGTNGVPGRRRSLPAGYQYKGFCGRRAQLRYLRQRAHLVERLRDHDTRAALERVAAAVAEDPERDYARLHLIHVALQAAEELTRNGTPTTWAASANFMLDHYDEVAETEKESA